MMAEEKKTGKIAVVRVRGDVDVRRTIRDTLAMMGLRKVNWAVVLDTTPALAGMVKKVKDFVTWGEIDEKTMAALVEKWGRKSGGKRLEKKEASELAKKLMAGQITFKEAGLKPVFRLHPPTKGHAREGIKKHVSIGGALGYRGKGINTLLARMAGLKDGTKAKKVKEKEGK